MTTVLLTGFEPFAGSPANPSWDAVQIVERGWDRTETLVTARLPVEFGTAADAVVALVAEHRPSIVIATGVAEGRTGVTPERVAVNLRDARIADNAGFQPLEQAIVPQGPAAIWSTLPVTAITAALTAAGIPASTSLSAGAFVCNDLFYRLQATTEGPTLAGFIHVPATVAMGLGPSVPTIDIGQIARALRIAIDVSLSALAP